MHWNITIISNILPVTVFFYTYVELMKNWGVSMRNLRVPNTIQSIHRIGYSLRCVLYENILFKKMRVVFKRLTKSNRADTIVVMKKHDLLDLRKSKAEQGIAKWLTMTNGPHPIQQMISRLLNAVASFHKGRKYLASSPFLSRLIVTQLVSSQHFWDTITCNMLLGTLQKLSTGSV